MPLTTASTYPLITADDIADNPAKALRNVPEGTMLLDSHTPLQSAALCELNRFTGSQIYRWIPYDNERGEALEDAERLARAWVATIGKPLSLVAGFAVESYVKNLRQLFLCIDIEQAEVSARAEAAEAAEANNRCVIENGHRITTTSLVQPAPNFSAPFPWHERLDETLEFLKAPASAIRFALDHVDPGQMRDFMEDWQEDHEAGEDHRTRHWLEMMKESLLYGQQVEAAEANNSHLLDKGSSMKPEPDYSNMRAFNRSLAVQRAERKALQNGSGSKG